MSDLLLQNLLAVADDDATVVPVNLLAREAVVVVGRAPRRRHIALHVVDTGLLKRLELELVDITVIARNGDADILLAGGGTTRVLSVPPLYSYSRYSLPSWARQRSKGYYHCQ